MILNWNGWKDTIECLESVLRSNYPHFRVVVCDNGSTDASMERIKDWADGLSVRHPSTGERLRRLPAALPKPIAYRTLSAASAEGGGSAADRDLPLVLIEIGANLGYAGGNNVGLRFLLASGWFDYVWLLNNDTVVEPDALAELVARLSAVPEAGLCGSTLLYHDSPATIQAIGGSTYNRWTGTGKQIRQFSTWRGPDGVELGDIERRVFAIQGASVLVKREFLERVGLLEEGYFLYFEEQDWAVRARRAGFRLVVAPTSVVYHKEGKSTGGSSRNDRVKSRLSDYYMVRSRLLFTRRHYPYALPAVYLSLLVTLLNRLRRRQWDRIPMLLRLCLRLPEVGNEGAVRLSLRESSARSDGRTQSES